MGGREGQRLLGSAVSAELACLTLLYSTAISASFLIFEPDGDLMDCRKVVNCSSSAQLDDMAVDEGGAAVRSDAIRELEAAHSELESRGASRYITSRSGTAARRLADAVGRQKSQA